MTDRDKIEIRNRLIRLIARRAGSGDDAAGAARRAYDELAVVLVPLISEPGFEALAARALQLAQREYPSGEALQDGNGKDKTIEAFVQIGLWLERQDQRRRIEATAAMFAAVADLLTTLIGESLTTRYLRKAWPDGFSGKRFKGKKA